MFMRLAKITVVVGFVSCSCASVQGQSWRPFSTRRGGLTVELPQRPRRATSKDETLPTLFPHTTGGFAYLVDLIPGGQPELYFGAFRLSKRLSNRRFDDIVNSNVLWISGDDKHFSKEADVTISGWHGRDFVYNKGDMSGRALFLNDANRVYYILINSTESNAVAADTVDRIFSSFRPLRR